METQRNILITGGAGFIGSHLVRLFVRKYPQYRVMNLDKLTYAGNLENLRDVEDSPNYVFVKGDVCDAGLLRDVFGRYGIDGVIHLAAESHVDRSIEDPLTFARTNVMGTLTLLQAAREAWEESGWKVRHGDAEVGCRFYHISTDEVYGALEVTYPEGINPSCCTGELEEGQKNSPEIGGRIIYGDRFFTEETKYEPHSPYSASKASGDHFVRAFHDTYGLPAIVTNCSNNYGPNQFPEKLIPLLINNIRHRKPLPVYGRGENVRDWLYVEDHARAIDTIFHRGLAGQTYNIGGSCERRNIDVVRTVIRIADRLLGRGEDEDMGLISYVTDRKGHDLRYAIDSSKLRRELGWAPTVGFEEGVERTVRWYLENQGWLDDVTSGDYLNYYESMYNNR
ncbi:MAG: dTDP-glucose 4,6-dehydratase [Bacteroidales bacterium]|nr:dTDP-glucose 4,6-dehydratase [Bacteroidales bacterium]